jgi:hypothetical protein
MQQISSDTRHLPLGMLHSTLRMQQLVVQGEIDAMQHYRISIRKAKDGQTPFPTDIIEHIASMLTWIQHSLDFFGESSLFPEAVDAPCNALITTLHYSNEQVSSLLRQLRALPTSESARARQQWQTLLTPLGTVEQAYDAIVQKQTVLSEMLAELRQAQESVPHSTQHTLPPSTVSATQLEHLADQVGDYLVALGLSSLPVSVHLREQHVRVNDLGLIIRPIWTGVTPSSTFNVPGWEPSYPSSGTRIANETASLAWELAASVVTTGVGNAHTLHYCSMQANSIKEAAIEAALWFLRRDLWQQHHSRLIPASPDDEVQENQEGISEETIHIYHLTVTCEPEHLDLILNHLNRLLAEHQSHASIVDVFDSAIRHETTLHFFSDDPIAPIIEEWLKKVDGVIDYGITQPSFHLIFEDETSIC